VYQILTAAGQNFEVVYVGSDRSLEYFNEYFSSMPWLAIPFGDARIDKLTKHFSIKGTQYTSFTGCKFTMCVSACSILC